MHKQSTEDNEINKNKHEIKHKYKTKDAINKHKDKT